MIKKIFFVIAFAAAAVAASALVKPGVETLRDNGFKVLEGKRVGLITNPTGVDNNLKSTVDILHEAPNVQLVALYGPEHGVRGDVHAGDKVGDSTDPATGVKVYSLYGKTRKPTKEMLKDIDVLVYDIQDIGCRSFTFISTMGVAMEACAEQGKEFVVLDRPNPLGGYKVEGNLVEGIDFKAHVVAANLMADLVMMLSNHVASHLLPGGIYISSGILTEKEKIVSEAIVKCGFRIIEVIHDGMWCAIAATL